MMKKLKLLIVLLFTTLLVACGGGTNTMEIEDMGQSAQDEGFRDSYEADDYDASEMDTENTVDNDNLKIVTTMDLDIETLDFDKSVKTVDNLVDKFEGFTASSNIYGEGDMFNNHHYRMAHYELKIPSDQLDDFIDSTGSIGEIVTESTDRVDKSREYQDVDSRIKVLDIKEERLLKLLEEADKMDDIISLENSLGSIIQEREYLTGSLKEIDYLVDYSTVNINVSEVDQVIKPNTKDKSFMSDVVETLERSFKEIKASSRSLVLMIIYTLPPIIILSPFILVGVYLYRKYKTFEK